MINKLSYISVNFVLIEMFLLLPCIPYYSCLLCIAEPTSGLDSATSVSVVHTLHDLAGLGVNVIATLHQPRQEILNLMHKLVLLAPDGRVVYCGPVLNLADHFSKIGNCIIVILFLLDKLKLNGVEVLYINFD